MIEIKITENDSGRRIDRFLKIYFEKAPLSFIYKNLRKKNIKLNDKKAAPEDILETGDVIKIYIADETINKFKKSVKISKNSKKPDILYEDKNVILVKKPVNMLTHNDSNIYKDNALDRMVDYLIANKEYNPRIEKSFRPAYVNRLDRNTSGILIGAKNLNSLQILNEGIKNHKVEKHYVTIVSGNVKNDFDININLKKTKDNVMVKSIYGKESVTEFKVLANRDGYSLLAVNLITGRTHQIRASLKEKSFNIIGDRKYGNKYDNDRFRNLGLDSQYLHNYEVKFNIDKLPSLKGKSFKFMPNDKMIKIAEDILQINLGEVLNEKGIF